MPQTAALKALVNRTPFNQLIDGLYSTIWIRKTAEGYAVSGRRKPTTPSYPWRATEPPPS